MRRNAFIYNTVIFMSIVGLVRTAYTLSNSCNNKKSSKLEKFNYSILVYKPNAPWVIKKLINLSLPEFTIAFTKIVELLTRPDLQYKYVDCVREEFFKEDYMEQFLWQCSCYHWFLQKLRVNMFTGELSSTVDKANPDSLALPLLEYWRLGSQVGVSNSVLLVIAQFYAFYCDCISYVYSKTINNTYCVRDEQHAYQKGIKSLKACIREFEKLIEYMQGTKYYIKYTLSLKQAKETLITLEQEKNK